MSPEVSVINRLVTDTMEASRKIAVASQRAQRLPVATAQVVTDQNRIPSTPMIDR